MRELLGQLENVSEEDYQAWIRGEAPLPSPESDAQFLPGWDDQVPPGVDEREWIEDRSVGLSKEDRALVQRPWAMAGGGQESLPGMEPSRPGRLTPEQIALGREWLPKVRRTLEEGLAPEPPDHLDNFNPQSQMSQQFLADRFAQQRAQPQHGYFGGTGAAMGGMAGGVNEWVQGMSNADRIALVSLLLAGGAAASGVGSPLAPLIVGGGAALAGQP